MGDPHGGRRLLLILLLVGHAALIGAWQLMTGALTARLELLPSRQAVRVQAPGQTSFEPTLARATLAPGATLVTDRNPATVLLFTDHLSLRLAPDSKLRVLGCRQLPTPSLEVALDRGRLWLERPKAWVSVTVDTRPARLRPGLGAVEIRASPTHLDVHGWTAPIRLHSRQDGRELARLDLYRGGRLEGRRWRVFPLDAEIDGWTSWNMHHPTARLLSEAPPPPVATERPPPQALPPPFLAALPSPAPAAEAPVSWGDEPGPRATPGPSPSPRGPFVFPGLPRPDYPLAGSRGAGGLSAGARAEAEAEAEAARALASAGTPAPGGSGPGEGAGQEPSAAPGRPLPEGLSQAGRDLVPEGQEDPPSPPVEALGPARQRLARVSAFLTDRFGMLLQAPLEVELVEPSERSPGSMELTRLESGWVARLPRGLAAADLQARLAALHGQAWMREQRLPADGPTALGFQIWLALKASIRIGSMGTARQLAGLGEARAPWCREQDLEAFQELWRVEESRGERGVFERVLRSDP